MGEGEGEVCVEVLNDGAMEEINDSLKVESKRNHECVVDGTDTEPCTKRQAIEACNNTQFVVPVEVLKEGTVDIEDHLRIESERDHEWAVDGGLSEPCVMRPTEACCNSDLVVYSKTQEGEVSNDVSNDSELDHCSGEQEKGTLGESEPELYLEKQVEEGLNDVELDGSANIQLKEASNDDIFSEVSNPNLSPSPRDITSKLQTGCNQLVEPAGSNLDGYRQITSLRSGNSSAEESFSEEENVISNTGALSKSCVVLEIPKHASTTGIRKITLKFSKRKEDHDKAASASVAQPVNSAFHDGIQNPLVPGDSNAEVNSCMHEKGVCGSSDPSFCTSNMELKMTKKVMADSHLSNVKKLLSTRILEGARVKYIPTNGGIELSGIIKDCGYLCGCSLCNFSRVISAYEFELHAGVKTRHPNNHIYLENGKPIYNIIQELKTAPLSKLEEVVKAVAGSSINKEYFQLFKANLHQHNEVPTADQSYYYKPVSKYHLLSRPKAFSASVLEHKKTADGGAKKRDNDLHRLLFMPNGLPDGTDLAYYSRGKRILGGYKQSNGIVCNCCHTEISPSQFEAHAGWAAKRQPYRHIYTSTGLTLHDIAVMLANGQNLTSTHSDDMCAACGDGGELIICDGCPRAFHPVCLGVQAAPAHDWRCPYCRDKSLPAREAAGESRPIIIRLKRVVKAPEYEPGGCVVCRAQDFSVAKFDDRTVIICDQCEKEYHVGCLRDMGLCDLKELPKDKWFCCHDCHKIYAGLQNFALGGPALIPASISNTIYQKQAERGLIHEPGNDIYWRILSGKSRYPEHLPLLSSAAAIFRECFDPIVAKSGRDLIPVMVYGRNISGQEFGGMYCVVLIVKSVVVSACLVRIFGREVAELPLVATSRENQGKGYFQTLFTCIEKLLFSMNVKNLVLPAAEEAESIWTKRFGFRKMSNERMLRYRNFQLTVFKGTSMLEKEVQQAAD